MGSQHLGDGSPSGRRQLNSQAAALRKSLSGCKDQFGRVGKLLAAELAHWSLSAAPAACTSRRHAFVRDGGKWLAVAAWIHMRGVGLVEAIRMVLTPKKLSGRRAPLHMVERPTQLAGPCVRTYTHGGGRFVRGLRWPPWQRKVLLWVG